MHTEFLSYLQARFTKTERGAALVEYALLLALIAVVCIVALTTAMRASRRAYSTRAAPRSVLVKRAWR